MSPPSPRSCNKNVTIHHISTLRTVKDTYAMRRGTGPKISEKNNIRQPSVLRFKHRIPTKLGWAARWHDLAVRSTLKENGLSSWPCAICESAKRPRRARRKAIKHAIKTYRIFFFFRFRFGPIIDHVRDEIVNVNACVGCLGRPTATYPRVLVRVGRI